MAAASGYSGKPLWEKLGVKPGLPVCCINGTAESVPEYWREAPFPVEVTDASAGAGFVHFFVDKRVDLLAFAARLSSELPADGTLWVSWPKKAARRGSDITEDTLRDVFLPLGLVDVKVCSVTDELWSGLKLVWRVELRSTIAARSGR